jgi:hypothetical protein
MAALKCNIPGPSSTRENDHSPLTGTSTSYQYTYLSFVSTSRSTWRNIPGPSSIRENYHSPLTGTSTSYQYTRPLTDRYLDRLDRHVVLRILGLDKSRPPYRDQVLLVEDLSRPPFERRRNQPYIKMTLCRRPRLSHELKSAQKREKCYLLLQ